VISFWIADALSALTADLLVAPPPITIDGGVLLFATALILLTTVVFGLLPAWNAASGATPISAGAGERVTRGNRRMTESFVVAQVTVAMLLLVGSGLMIRSYWRLQNVDAGFVADDVLVVPLSLPEDRYSPERAATFFNDLFAQLESLPGVVSAGATTTNPFRQWGFSNNVTPEDRAAETPPTGLLQAGWRAVTPGFFDTLRVPLVAGRAFTSRDGSDGQRSVIVSTSLARALWPDGDAVGRRLYWGGVDGTPWTVVGVAGDVRDLRVEAPPQPMLYLPHQNIPLGSMTVVLRTSPGAGDLAGAVRGAIQAIDPSLPVPEVQTLAANRDAAVSTPRIRTLVLTLVGSVALVLASVGLYGLVAFGVAQRVREVGIRMALGASRSDIVRLFLSRGLVLAGVGLTAGLLGAWMLSRTLESLVFETEVRDPLLFTAAAVVLASVMALASYLPARRAASVDPVRVLNR
jgi:predicted permease